MGKNFFGRFKHAFIEPVEHGLSDATHYVGDSFEKFVAKPVASASQSFATEVQKPEVFIPIIVGVVGAAAIVATGGLATPAVLGAEAAAIGGTEAAVLGGAEIAALEFGAVGGAEAIGLSEPLLAEAAIEAEAASSSAASSGGGFLSRLGTGGRQALSAARASRFGRAAGQVGQLGAKVGKVASKAGPILSVGATLGEIVETSKLAKIEGGKGIGRKVSNVGNVAKIAGLISSEAEQNIRLLELGKDVKDVGNFITKVEEQATLSRDQGVELSRQIIEQGRHILATGQEELNADKSHIDTIKELIGEKHGEQEADKHQAVVLDNELQALAKIEKQEEDILNQIRTSIDIPSSSADFMKDIRNLNNPDSILQYLAENMAQFNQLDPNSRNQVLDMALNRGVLVNV